MATPAPSTDRGATNGTSGEPLVERAVERALDPSAVPGRSRTVKPGHLPVSETSFDKPGAPSPFGDDITFPLPVNQLVFSPLGEQDHT